MNIIKRLRSVIGRIKKLLNPQENRFHIEKHLESFANSIPKGKKVIDIGSRKPAYIQNIRRVFSHCDVTTSDLFEGEEIDMVLDASNMPFENETVDVFTCTEVLEHVYDFMAIINECHRVLKNGGKMFFSTPYYFPEHEKPGMPDYWRFTHQALEKMFVNFKNVEVIACGGKKRAPVGYVVIIEK